MEKLINKHLRNSEIFKVSRKEQLSSLEKMQTCVSLPIESIHALNDFTDSSNTHRIDYMTLVEQSISREIAGQCWKDISKTILANEISDFNGVSKIVVGLKIGTNIKDLHNFEISEWDPNKPYSLPQLLGSIKIGRRTIKVYNDDLKRWDDDSISFIKRLDIRPIKAKVTHTLEGTMVPKILIENSLDYTLDGFVTTKYEEFFGKDYERIIK